MNNKNTVLDIGSRRELFVDRFLVDAMDGVAFRLHHPQPATPAAGPISGSYMTVFPDGDRYRAYFRRYDPAFRGEKRDGSEGEYTGYAESRDGVEWAMPELGLYTVNGSRRNNAVLRQAPFSHNFAPFLDANPAADPRARYKALAGTYKGDHGVGDDLHAFGSADGIRWEPLHDGPVITHASFAFDSQNVSFWSAAEGCYVCYFRTWNTSHGWLRSISRSTSRDFRRWSEPVPTNPNLPGEHLYTSQTHPYFRAPHLYVALPTRFMPDRGDSTDILFMVARAGTERFERLFTEAFIPPGPDPERWGNRSNYAACGVVPTGPAEISIYHGPAGLRYTLRTDGFISLRGGYAGGTATTKPFTFAGSELTLNVATSAAGSVRVELRDAEGRPVPGRTLPDADEIAGDAIEQRVTWKGDADVSAWAGRPVRLHIVLREADLYALRFVPPFYGAAAPAMTAYFETLKTAGGPPPVAFQPEQPFTQDFVEALRPSVEAAREAARGCADDEARLAPVTAGYDVARRAAAVRESFLSLTSGELERRLDEIERDVLLFRPGVVFGQGPALYPPLAWRWAAFRKYLTDQRQNLVDAFAEPRIALNLDKRWRFQIDPEDAGLGAGWMAPDFDASAWPLLDADRWWQDQGYPEYHGVAWYRRTLNPPAVAHDRRLVLYFGAVDGDATVFVNGAQAFDRCLGPDGVGWDEPFHIDVTRLLADRAPVHVAVRVRKDGQMSGIFRGVKLLDVSVKREL